MQLVTHVSGLGVVKRVIMHLQYERTYQVISDFLINNSLMLIQNQYGNYALHTAIEVNYLI